MRLLRLAALRELRGGWALMLAASALLIIAAGLVALPLVFRAATADLALREMIEQSNRAVHFVDHTRADRPATQSDVEATAGDGARTARNGTWVRSEDCRAPRNASSTRRR